MAKSSPLQKPHLNTRNLIGANDDFVLSYEETDKTVNSQPAHDHIYKSKPPSTVQNTVQAGINGRIHSEYLSQETTR